MASDGEQFCRRVKVIRHDFGPFVGSRVPCRRFALLDDEPSAHGVISLIRQLLSLRVERAEVNPIGSRSEQLGGDRVVVLF